MRSSLIVFFESILFLPSILFAQLDSVIQPGNYQFSKINSSLININDWIYWQSNDGRSGSSPYTGSTGGFFPDQTPGALYCDGFIWAGKVQDQDTEKPVLRAGGNHYRNGTQPGWIVNNGSIVNSPMAVNPNDPRARIYRIRPDFESITKDELKEEAISLFDPGADNINQKYIDTLKVMYARDWHNWPGDLGAPYYDKNDNNIWDPGIDEPGIANADQVLWYVVNDLDTELCKKLYGSPPIGLELQVTVWAYKKDTRWFGFDNIIFKRYRLINKSGFEIDSMCIGQFADIDIGDYSDDLAGCDSALSLGYGYNSEKQLEPYFGPLFETPASIGYAFLQGPVVSSNGDKAFLGFQTLDDYKNLPMTSFTVYGPGFPWTDPAFEDYTGTLQIHNILNGYPPDYTGGPSIIIGNSSKTEINRYWFNGDPISGTGDVDGNAYQPGDRRIYLCSGPFDMQPGEVQEVAVAIIGSQGGLPENYLFSINELKEMTSIFKELYQGLPESILPINEYEPPPGPEKVNLFILGQNYPNPFNSETTLRFRLLGRMDVSFEICNTLGQVVKTIFKGYGTVQEYTFVWDGKDNKGNIQPSGLYFIHLADGLRGQTKKIIFLK